MSAEGIRPLKRASITDRSGKTAVFSSSVVVTDGRTTDGSDVVLSIGSSPGGEEELAEPVP